MGNKKYDRFASYVVVTVTSASVIFGSVPIAIADTPTAGDTASKVPTVEQACTALRNAADGKLLDMNGKPLTFTAPECVAKAKRERTVGKCQATAEDLTKQGETADTLCARDRGSLNSEAAAFCALRQINKTNTTVTYCDAYDSASRAQNGVAAMLAVDGAAAAVCWTEYASLTALKSGSADSMNAAATKAGPCSMASIGAALAEITNIVMANTGSNNHASGEYSVDSDYNVTKKDDKSGPNITKILDIIMSSGLSLAVLRNGLCQQTRGAQRTYTRTNTNGSVVVQDPSTDSSMAKKGALGFLGQDGLQKVCGFMNARIAGAGKALREKTEKIGAVTQEAEDAQALADNAKKAEKEALEAVVNSNCGDSVVKDYVAKNEELRNLENNGDPGTTLNPSTDSPFTIDLGGATKPAGCTRATSAAWEAAKAKAKKELAAMELKVGAMDKTGKTLEKIADTKRAAKHASDGRAAIEQAKIDAARTNLQPRVDVTKSSAMMLTALAAIRGISLASAGSTKKKAKEVLQSMFNASNGTVSYGGTTSVAPPSIYASLASTYAPTTNPAQTAQAVTAGTPEAMLLPPGTSLNSAAMQVARQIPGGRLQEAADSGAAGIGGLISSAASGMGAKDVSEINPAVATAFANLPHDDGAGYSGGGGKSLAKSGDSSGDLNLKGLFGGGDKEEHAGAAAPGLAFRGPASDDIWHSQNPKGNNLFQIVSDRYDTAQRKQDLHP